MSGRYKLAGYVAVATLVRAGDEGSGPAVLLTAAALGQSTGHGAVVLATLTAATALGGPVAGAGLDRLHRPRIGYLVGLGAMVAGLLGLALGLGHGGLGPSCAAAALAGLAQPMFSGGWSALLGRLVGPTGLQRAAALDAVTYDVGGIAGPALVAVGLAWSARTPLLACAVLAGLALPVLATMRFPPPPADSLADRPSLRGELAAGGRVIAQRPALRRITVLSVLQHAGTAGRTLAAPLLAVQLTGSAGLAGTLLAVSAAASLSASLLLTRWSIPLPPATTAGLATAVSAAAVGLLAIAGPLWIGLALFAVGGLTDAPLLTSVFAVRNAEAPARLRTGVFATGASLKTSAYAAATLAFGLLVGGSAAGCLVGSAVVQGAGLLALRRRSTAQPAPTPAADAP